MQGSNVFPSRNPSLNLHSFDIFPRGGLIGRTLFFSKPPNAVITKYKSLKLSRAHVNLSCEHVKSFHFFPSCSLRASVVLYPSKPFNVLHLSLVKDFASRQIPLSCEEADCEGLDLFVVLGSSVTSVTLEVKEMCDTSYTAAALGGVKVRGAYWKTGKTYHK